MVTLRTHVLLLLLILTSAVSWLVWWGLAQECPVGREVRPDLCGIWLVTFRPGQRRSLDLLADGTFLSRYDFARGNDRSLCSGTWTADSELVVLLIDADHKGPIKPQGRWRRYLPIMADGRLRGVWWRPEDPEWNMYSLTPGLHAPDKPR